MKAIVGLFAVASSAAAILASGSPAAAQFYNPLRSRPVYSFTPSQSNVRYVVHPPQSFPGSGYGGYSSQPSRNRGLGFGYGSGSYFGW